MRVSTGPGPETARTRGLFGELKLTPRIGTEITIGLESLLDGRCAAELRGILEKRGVLIFRGLNLEDSQQLAFARTIGTVRLGDLEKRTENGKIVKQHESEDGIFKVTFDVKENPTYAQYLVGTFCWHMDGTWEEVPPLGAILTPRVLSPEGGQTEFASTYAAYEDLPAAEKARLEKLTVTHTMEANYGSVVPNPTADQVKDWRSYPVRRHPLVWTHRSGRKSLVLSSSAASIDGLGQGESDELLRRLWQWVTRPQYVYRHQWKMGDMLVWDNTGTMHRVLPYDRTCGRRLHRVSLVGEESIRA